MIIINSYSSNQNRNVSSFGPWVCWDDERQSPAGRGVERLTAKDRTLKSEVFESLSTSTRTKMLSSVSRSTNSFGSKGEENNRCATATDSNFSMVRRRCRPRRKLNALLWPPLYQRENVITRLNVRRTTSWVVGISTRWDFIFTKKLRPLRYSRESGGQLHHPHQHYVGEREGYNDVCTECSKRVRIRSCHRAPAGRYTDRA